MIFEIASRKRFRFDSAQGALSTEDLWDVPLTSTNPNRANLDDIARALHKQLKETDDVSFVVEKKVDSTIQVKFDIVKHIIDIRVEEARVAAEVKANKDKKQQILTLIAQKENEQLAGSSLEDLKKLADSL